MSLGRYLKVTLQKGGAYGVGLTVNSTTISNLFYNPSLNLQSTIFAENSTYMHQQKSASASSKEAMSRTCVQAQEQVPPSLLVEIKT